MAARRWFPDDCNWYFFWRFRLEVSFPPFRPGIALLWGDRTSPTIYHTLLPFSRSCPGAYWFWRKGNRDEDYVIFRAD